MYIPYYNLNFVFCNSLLELVCLLSPNTSRIKEDCKKEITIKHYLKWEIIKKRKYRKKEFPSLKIKPIVLAKCDLKMIEIWHEKDGKNQKTVTDPNLARLLSSPNKARVWWIQGGSAGWAHVQNWVGSSFATINSESRWIWGDGHDIPGSLETKLMQALKKPKC